MLNAEQAITLNLTSLFLQETQLYTKITTEVFSMQILERVGCKFLSYLWKITEMAVLDIVNWMNILVPLQNQRACMCFWNKEFAVSRIYGTRPLAKWVECLPMVWETGVQS